MAGGLAGSTSLAPLKGPSEEVVASGLGEVWAGSAYSVARCGGMAATAVCSSFACGSSCGALLVSLSSAPLEGPLEPDSSLQTAPPVSEASQQLPPESGALLLRYPLKDPLKEPYSNFSGPCNKPLILPEQYRGLNHDTELKE